MSTKITVVDANKFNPVYFKNTVHFPLVMYLDNMNSTKDDKPIYFGQNDSSQFLHEIHRNKWIWTHRRQLSAKKDCSLTFRVKEGEKQRDYSEGTCLQGFTGNTYFLLIQTRIIPPNLDKSHLCVQAGARKITY